MSRKIKTHRNIDMVNLKKNIHISFIMDGNRRFSSNINANLKYQHLLGALKVEEIILYCYNNPNIKYLTLDAFLENNWKRDSKEINQILALNSKALNFFKIY